MGARYFTGEHFATPNVTLSAVDAVSAQNHVKELLALFGYTVETRPDIADTPVRVVAMLQEMFHVEPLKFTTFDDGDMPASASDMGIVLVENIPFSSMCAHHVLPFMGVAHVAYIPTATVLGISKLARVVTTFSKGLRTQEEIGALSVEFLMKHAKALGAAVVLEAEHTCMSIRGAKAHGAITTTSALRGVFFEKPEVRAELMGLLHLHKR